MGNICLSRQNKYNKINHNIINHNENESELELEVFDINTARKNAKSIKVESKEIYEKHFENILKDKIISINKIIKKESTNINNYCVAYIHTDNCRLEEINKEYRNKEYDKYYIDKFMDKICVIYRKKGYNAKKDNYRCYVIISWNS